MDPTAPVAEPAPASVTLENDADYLVAVIRKQRPQLDAAATAAKLTADQAAAIVAAGRTANMAELGELLAAL